MTLKRAFITAILLSLVSRTPVLANGGAWQTGVPNTGNGAATDQKKTTNVTIDEENLTIDLHQEFASVEVRYRMRNTGPAVEQDFYFPVELWAASEENKPTDLDDYQITSDSVPLKWANVDAQGEKPKPVTDEHWGEFPAGRKIWKKSRIPFDAGGKREVVIRYRSSYAVSEGSVSDDEHVGEARFQYSLSPAATWKGPIGKGKITINILHPRPEETTLTKPKDRFKKVNPAQFVWDFHDLKPTLADDIKIVAHPAYDRYPADGYSVDPGEHRFRADYIIQGDRYFLANTDYDAVASSTLKADGEHKYDIDNIKGIESSVAWSEGVDGDGIGESITLTARRPLPLDAILIVPGYRAENQELWTKNNRVAEMSVTLNGEHSFTAKIPDEKFTGAYPLPVRDYSKPVQTIKLTINAVHRGSRARDTCISMIELRGKLSKKPTIRPAR